MTVIHLNGPWYEEGKKMQAEKELCQSAPSETFPLHPIRDRVGILIEATGVKDAIAHIGEAEPAGVQQVWMGSGIADTLTLFAARPYCLETSRKKETYEHESDPISHHWKS